MGRKYPGHEVYAKHIVIIFDECHRSQFGDMHTAIVKNFKKYHLFGFTGTPIFSVNSGRAKNPEFFTTGQTFGDQLHSYTIVDAINDKNVLPFRVDYIKTMDTDEEITDEMVWDINREKVMMASERIRIVTQYILEHFDQKTYRGDKTYIYNTLTNIEEVVSAKRDEEVEEIKQKQRISGFNSIFAVSSVTMAKLYYAEFKKQMAEDPTKKLRVATIFSYGANEEETDGILDEENSEDTSAFDQPSREFLEEAIRDYNEMFHTNYDTSSDKFQNYYAEEKLKPEDTRKFMENAFRDGEIKTSGTEIDKLMPPISRFGGGGRAKKKQGVIVKLKTFFEKYFGIGGQAFFTGQEKKVITYDLDRHQPLSMVAEPTAPYGEKS